MCECGFEGGLSLDGLSLEDDGLACVSNNVVWIVIMKNICMWCFIFN